MIGGIVLAGGEGRRFGAIKQLAELDGRPLLEHAVGAMVGAEPVDEVVVVLGANAEQIAASANLHGARPVVCGAWAEGQSASLRAGLEALGGADAVVVTLGDQPRITSDVISLVVSEASSEGRWHPTRATYGGTPGHPVVLPRELFPRLLEGSGDKGARDLLAELEVRDVEAGHLGRADDVDTEEQLERLRD